MMLWCWKRPAPATTFSLYNFSHKLTTNQKIRVTPVILPFLKTRIKKHTSISWATLAIPQSKTLRHKFQSLCVVYLTPQHYDSCLRRVSPWADLRRKHAGHDRELITRTAYVFWNPCPFLITFD